MPKINKSKQKLKDSARFMPPMYHSVPGEKFSYKTSEALAWILKSPYALEYVWNAVKSSGAIEYDSATGKWHGVDWSED